jgi:hypothetical protein
VTDVGAVQYSSLDRFLVSAGALVIAADVVFVWVLTQRADALLVLEADLEGLTSIGRAALARQQALVGWLLEWWPLIAIGLVVLALGLIVWGLIRWTPVDSAERSARQAKAKHDEHLYARPATARELLEERIEQGVEEVSADLADSRKSTPVSEEENDAELSFTIAELISQFREQAPRDPARSSSFISWYRDHAQLEDVVSTAIARAVEGDYEVARDIRIGSDTQGTVADLILLAKAPGEASYVIETKLGIQLSPRTAVIGVRQARSLAEIASAVFKRSVEPRCLIVYDGDAVGADALLAENRPELAIVSLQKLEEHADDAQWIRNELLGIS